MSFTYTNFKFPARRKGCYTAQWIGTDDSLLLRVFMDLYTGEQTHVDFPCTVPGTKGTICLPNGVDITDASHIPDEALVAALRMSTLVSDTLVGSTEWIAALSEGETANIQTAMGVVKIKVVNGVAQVRELGDAQQQNIEIDFVKNATSNPVRTLAVTRDQFPSRAAYAAAVNPEVMILPDFQARCAIPGEIEKVYSGYVHDYANNVVLTQTQKDNIVALVAAMDPWI